MIRKLAPLAAAAALFAAPAFAQSKGDFTLGVGLHQVQPKSDNGTLVNGALPIDIENSLRPTVTGEYFIADNLGIELIAAWPFKHNIHDPAGNKIGTVQHLPPTLSVQYHFGAPEAVIKPFVGAGVNYTFFYDESAHDYLAGNKLSLGNSWGAALHAGIDFQVGTGAVRVDVRKIDIDSKVKLNGVDIGTTQIDPLVYGASYLFKF